MECIVKIANQTYNCEMPIKCEKYPKFNGELASAIITLANVKKAEFKPLTAIEITSNNGNDSYVWNGVITNDEYQISPLNRNLYKHTLTCCDRMKIMEGYLMPSLTVRQPVNNINYLDSVDLTDTKLYTYNITTGKTLLKTILEDSGIVSTPVYSKTYTLPSMHEIFNMAFADIPYASQYPLHIVITANIYGYDDPITIREELTQTSTDTQTAIEYYNKKLEIPINDTYHSLYLNYYLQVGNGTEYIVALGNLSNSEENIPLATLYMSKHRYTLKDELERVLALAEPLYYDSDFETPIIHTSHKFTLAEDDGIDLSIECPEFSFTRNTLREIVNQFGNYIQAVPYLEQNVLHFKKISTEKKEINIEAEQGSLSIDNYANEVDGYTDNIIGETISEAPFTDGYSTLRNETAYGRFTESDSMVIYTMYPIYKIKRVLYKDTNGDIDITSCIYESAIYNSQIKDYSKVYPYSKCYALYYTQNSQHIKGLFYKNTTISGGVFDNYAIVNILSKLGANNIPSDIDGYKAMQFQVEYYSLISDRIIVAKTNPDEWLPIHRAVNYSQSANMVDMVVYGEHLRATIEKMGKLEKTITYTCKNASSILNCGDRVGDYVVLTSTIEVMFDKFKVSCSLSKDYIKISDYVGINSFKRTYEVATSMVADRHDVLTMYVDIETGTDYSVETDPKVSTTLLQQIATTFDKTFSTSATITTPIGAVIYKTYSEANVELCSAILPISKCRYGNSIQYSFETLDNFAVGVYNRTKQIGTTTYTYSDELPYTDYYGNVDKEQWEFINNVPTYLANDLPKYSGTDEQEVITTPIIEKRKDNAEHIKNSLNLQFISHTCIIGSALSFASVMYNGNITDKDGNVVKVKLAFFDTIIDNLGLNIPDIAESYDCDNATIGSTTKKIVITGKTPTATRKSWAYILDEYDDPKQQIIKDGEIVDYYKHHNAQILVAKNEDCTTDGTYGDIRIAVKYK